MKILLVEDEDPKQRHIEAYLRVRVKDLALVTAKSYNSAIDALELGLPDLLLLDMSLPTFDRREQEGGGRPQGLGGVEILRYMKLSELSCPIVVITGHDAFPKPGGQVVLAQLEAELAKEFPNMFRGVLHYNSAYDEWKQNLSDQLNNIETANGAAP
jgi:CheY-like chemotaxis protein